MADDPEVIAVLKEANEAGGGVFGGDWHSDFSFLAKPPAGSVLVVVEVPPFGGDTLWANQELALETLPADLRRQITGRDGIHSGKLYGVARRRRRNTKWPVHQNDARRPGLRPRTSAPADSAGILKAASTPCSSTRSTPPAWPTATKRPAPISPRPSVPSRHPARLAAAGAGGRRRRDPGQPHDPALAAVNDYDGYRRLLYRTTCGDPRTPDNQLLASQTPAIVKRKRQAEGFHKTGLARHADFFRTTRIAWFSGSAMPKRWSRRRWSRA